MPIPRMEDPLNNATFDENEQLAATDNIVPEEMNALANGVENAEQPRNIHIDTHDSSNNNDMIETIETNTPIRNPDSSEKTSDSPVEHSAKNAIDNNNEQLADDANNELAVEELNGQADIVENTDQGRRGMDQIVAPDSSNNNDLIRMNISIQNPVEVQEAQLAADVDSELVLDHSNVTADVSNTKQSHSGCHHDFAPYKGDEEITNNFTGN